MTFTLIGAIVVGLISVLLVCKVLKKNKKPLTAAFVSAFFGMASLGAVNLLSIYTGVSIAVNYVTAFIAVVLGAPGVIGVLVMRVLMQM